MTVKDGWLVCPCGNKHLLQIRPGTEAKELTVYCRRCKREHIVDIVKGECVKRQGR